MACIGDMAFMARLTHDFLFYYSMLFDLSIHLFYYLFDHFQKVVFLLLIYFNLETLKE